MKLNLDCVRDILLTIEKHPIPMNLNFYNFCELLPNYSKDEILYCCKRLYEANYLNLKFISIQNCKPQLDEIGDLTFYGHEFLENIKNDTNWNKTKNIALKVGSFSFEVIKEISTSVISDVIKKVMFNA